MRFVIYVLIAFAISGCDQKQAVSTPPPPPPIIKLTATERVAAEEFAKAIVEAADNGETSALAGMQDFDELWNEAVRGVNAPKEFLLTAKAGFMETAKLNGGLFGAFIGKPVKFLRVHERDGETVLLLRLREGQGGAGYSDLYLKKSANGKFLVRDIYSYALGESSAAVMRRAIAQGVAAQTKSPLAKVFGVAKSGFTGAELEKAFGLAKLLQAEKFQEILTVSSTFSDELRKERFVLSMRVQAAMALDDDVVYLKTLDELAAAFPKDPSVDFILMDRHFLKKDFKKALSVVEQLTAQLGNDAFLATLQSGCLIALNQLDDAEAAIKAGIEIEPDDSGIQLQLVDLLAKKKDNSGIRKQLELIYERFKQVIDPKQAEAAGLTEFFASPDGKAYTEFLRKAGEI